MNQFSVFILLIFSIRLSSIDEVFVSKIIGNLELDKNYLEPQGLDNAKAYLRLENKEFVRLAYLLHNVGTRLKFIDSCRSVMYFKFSAHMFVESASLSVDNFDDWKNAAEIFEMIGAIDHARQAYILCLKNYKVSKRKRKKRWACVSKIKQKVRELSANKA